MNPQALSVKDYRAFTSADLDLSGVDAAAIVGPNGAGKSTVCEAIIWALFGEGRSSSVDGVVRLGSDEASVQLDYAHSGQVYRVIRKRTRGKRSDLQYLVFDAGEWKPLSGASMRETQEKIVRDLSMDEALFLNSSCVMQGKSAGICEATPADRKAVLYRVLEDRLAKFGPLHEAAKATVKALDAAMATDRCRRAELETRVEAKGELVAAKTRATDGLTLARSNLAAAESDLDSFRRAAAQSRAQAETLDGITKQLSDISREISLLEDQIAGHQRTIDAASELLAKADEIRAHCDRAAELEVELEALQNAQERHQVLIQRYRDKELEYKTRLDEVNADLQREDGKLQRLRDQALGTVDRAKADLAQAEFTAALLNDVPCKSTPMADECKLLYEARNAAERIDSHEQQLRDALAEIDRIDNAIKDIHTKAVAGAEELIARRDEELLELRFDARELGYNPETHTARKNEYARAKSAREILPELSGAEARTMSAHAAIGEARKSLQGKRLQIMGLEKDREQVVGRLQVPDVLHEAALDEKMARTRTDVERLTRDLAVTEERLGQIEAAESQLARIVDGLAGQERQRGIHATLQDAFSRDGIPALIIDAAIPQIEEHANEILARLSDGRMTLKFITQRTKSTGGIAETLDIIVSDSQGERPYEDWSGGEKLRIDLSVRIALGQVLAQRTGARIELLILDEVCAPLDEAGEEALVDCIGRLSASFGCILLITHRESLKDRLPQQIIVSKNGAGSEVRLMA